MSSNASFTISSINPLFAISLLISRMLSLTAAFRVKRFIADNTSVLFSRCPTLRTVASCSVSIMLTLFICALFS